MKTAVEWLEEQVIKFHNWKLNPVFDENCFDEIELRKAIQQAKEMEKYQRQEDTNYGYSQGWDDGNQNKEPMRPELKQQDNEDNNKISN
jgi:hypothetical protein